MDCSTLCMLRDDLSITIQGLQGEEGMLLRGILVVVLPPLSKVWVCLPKSPS